MENELKPGAQPQQGVNTQKADAETDEETIIDLFDEVIDDTPTGDSPSAPAVPDEEVLDLTDLFADAGETDRIMGVHETIKADSDDADDIIELEDFYEPTQQPGGVIELGDLDLDPSDLDTEIFPSEIIGDSTDTEPVLDLDLDLTAESAADDKIDPDFLELTENVDTARIVAGDAAMTVDPIAPDVSEDPNGPEVPDARDAQNEVTSLVDASAPQMLEAEPATADFPESWLPDDGDDDDDLLELTDFAKLTTVDEPPVDIGVDTGLDIEADDEEPLELDQFASFPELEPDSANDGEGDPTDLAEIENENEIEDEAIIDLALPVEEAEVAPGATEGIDMEPGDAATVAAAMAAADLTKTTTDRAEDNKKDEIATDPIYPPSGQKQQVLSPELNDSPSEVADVAADRVKGSDSDQSQLDFAAVSSSATSAVDDVLDELLLESEELDKNLDREFKRELDLDNDAENDILSRLGMELDANIDSDEDITGTLIKTVAPGDEVSAEATPEVLPEPPAGGPTDEQPASELTGERVDAAVQRAVNKLFAEKIEAKVEKMILAAIDQAVGKEIQKLKTILLEEEPEDLD